MPKRSTLTFTSEDKYRSGRGGGRGGAGAGRNGPSSTEAASAQEEEARRRRVYIYACAASEEPAVLMTDACLEEMPARRSDGARVVDRHKYYVKLNCAEEPHVRNVKIRRVDAETVAPPASASADDDGKARQRGEEEGQSLYIERQRRFVTASYGLPIAYVDNKSDRFLYIIKDALVLASHA